MDNYIPYYKRDLQGLNKSECVDVGYAEIRKFCEVNHITPPQLVKKDARGKPLLQKTGLRAKLLVAWLRVNTTCCSQIGQNVKENSLTLRKFIGHNFILFNMAVVSAYIGKTSESGQATMYNVAFRYNGRDYLQNVWVPKSAVYYYRASTCKLSVDDWVLKKVVELAVANPNKPLVDRGALLNGVEW